MPSIKRVVGGLWSLAKDISENVNSPNAGDFVVNLRDIDLANGDVIPSGSTGCVTTSEDDVIMSEKRGTVLFIHGLDEIEVSIPSLHENAKIFSSIEWKSLARIEDSRVDDFKERLAQIRTMSDSDEYE